MSFCLINKFGVKSYIITEINEHLTYIYRGGLVKEATTEKISVVQLEGTRQVNREPMFYNLDAIISVGYRVSSIRATMKYCYSA